MYCMYCGTKNPDAARFCNNCGKPMSVPASNASPVNRTVPVSEPAYQRKENAKQAGGKIKRLFIRGLVILVVYLVSYGVGNVIAENKTKPKDIPETSSPGLIQINPDLVEISTQPALPETGYKASLDGYWEKVNIKDGDFNLNVSALTFYETVYSCTEMTVTMDVTMNAGTSCKSWNVWGRSGNKFVKIGKIDLPAGDGYVSQTLKFSSPVTFDAIAVTPTIIGSYSWSMSLGITDVYTK